MENNRHKGPTATKRPPTQSGPPAQSAHRHKAPTGTGQEYLLSGLLECAACGGAFCGVTKISQKKIETPYYICLAKHRNKTCNAHNINANELDELAARLVKESI